MYYYGRLEGLLSGVSAKGDWGFVYPSTMQLAPGFTDKVLPSQRVFVHIKRVIDVNRLIDGLPVTFGVVDSKSKAGALDAVDVIVPPKCIGTVRLAKGHNDFGFIDPETIDYYPDLEDTSKELPQTAVFIHVKSVKGADALTEGMRLGFYPHRISHGRNKDKLEACCVERVLPSDVVANLKSWRQDRRRLDDEDVEMRDFEWVWSGAKRVVESAEAHHIPLAQIVTDQAERENLEKQAGAHDEIEEEEERGWPAAEDPPEDEDDRPWGHPL